MDHIIKQISQKEQQAKQIIAQAQQQGRDLQEDKREAARQVREQAQQSATAQGEQLVKEAVAQGEKHAQAMRGESKAKENAIDSRAEKGMQKTVDFILKKIL